MALIHPFRALRPDARQCRLRLLRSVRRRQHRRSPRARRGQSAQLSARDPVRDRSAARRGSLFAARVYEKARENFDALRETRAARRRGRAGAVSLPAADGRRTSRPAWPAASRSTSTSSDVIKKHERTRRDKEDDRTRHMIELRAQTGVVFLTYAAVAARRCHRAARVTAGAPLFDFTARRRRAAHHLDGRRRGDAASSSTAFAQIPALYIADGHHRAASAARARPSCGSARRRRARRGHLHRRGVPRQPGADPALQPHRSSDLAGRTAGAVPRGASRARSRSPTARDAAAARARSRCISTASGTRWICGRRAGGRVARQQPRRRAAAATTCSSRC